MKTFPTIAQELIRKISKNIVDVPISMILSFFQLICVNRISDFGGKNNISSIKRITTSKIHYNRDFFIFSFFSFLAKFLQIDLEIENHTKNIISEPIPQKQKKNTQTI